MRKNYQKLGFIIKISDSRKMASSRRKQPRLSLRPRVALIAVSHYHQRPGTHPAGVRFKGREQCIEVVTHGRGWVNVNGHWQQVGPGDLLWHVAGENTIG